MKKLIILLVVIFTATIITIPAHAAIKKVSPNRVPIPEN